MSSQKPTDPPAKGVKDDTAKGTTPVTPEEQKRLDALAEFARILERGQAPADNPTGGAGETRH